MKKLFIFQNAKNPYKEEVECAYERTTGDKVKIDSNDLTLDYLLKNEIEIVASSFLAKEWYYLFKGLNIVSVTFGNREKCYEYADIVIDYLSKDDKRYFTGSDYSVRNNKKMDIDGIVNLITKLEWDSSFFGFNVAFLSCMRLTENIIYRIEKFIKKENIHLIEYLCNCHDKSSVRIAETNGFNFTDIRLTFRKSLTKRLAVSLDGLTFCKADEKDIPLLREMSKMLYEDSRYFFDDNFGLEKVQEFYSGWVSKGVLGQYDDECWCLYEDKPVAFCTVKYDKIYADIGLIGVSENQRGRGLGRKMLSSVLNTCFEKGIKQVFTVTQGRNYAAQNLYQCTGFRTKSTQLWYHKWL